MLFYETCFSLKLCLSILCVPAFTLVCVLSFYALCSSLYLSMRSLLDVPALISVCFSMLCVPTLISVCLSMLGVPALTSVCVLCSLCQPYLGMRSMLDIQAFTSVCVLCSMFQPWLQYVFLCSMFQPLPRYAFYARCFSLRAITCNFGIYCPRLVALRCALCEVSSDMTWGLKSMSDNYKVNTSVWYLR